MAEKIKPLEGLVVLGVEQFIAGPYCTMLLADAGAEVIKLERPGVGDPRRTIGPYATARDGKTKVSGGFLEYNRNKKSITLNIQKPEGKAILQRLITGVDVLVENFRPGTMDKLGLGYQDLRQVNPRLIYAAVSGFGQLAEFSGPYSKWPAFDIVAEAMSGVMHMIGFADRPPTTSIYGLADTCAGMVTALGVMFALYARARTGEGQFIDTAMYDSMLAINERAVAAYALTGEVSIRGKEGYQGPRGAFKAADGYVALNIPTDDMWMRLTGVLGRPDLVADPRSANGPSRAENCDEFLRPVIEGWMADKTKAEVVQLLVDAGVPAGPVQTSEDLFSCPQVAARRMLVEIDDPQLGPIKLARTAPRLSGAAEVEGRPVPALGQHNAEVYGRIGISAAELEELRAKGVV